MAELNADYGSGVIENMKKDVVKAAEEELTPG
jgi:hypothetical protein